MTETVKAPVALIQKWLDAKALAANAVETERALRADLSKELFPTPVKGTQRYALKAGYAIKMVYPLVYTLGDKEKVEDGRKVPVREQVDALCDAIEATGNTGALMAERLIRWTPELVVPEYEKLDVRFENEKEIKALIDAMLTIKPGSPQMSMEEPKAKK